MPTTPEPVVVDGIEIWLGRVEATDDRDHPMAAQLLGEVPRTSRYYRTGVILDQGRTNSCVGYSCRQWMQTAPVMYKAGSPSGWDVYQYALTVDEFHGEQDTGTSLRAGIKSLQHFGRVESYVWAGSADEVRAWIMSDKGSVIVGTQITENMVKVDSNYYMNPTGRLLGGHAYLLMGYSVPRQAFRVCNSWGRSWAQQGRAWLRFSDFSDLLSARGDAVGVIENRL